MGNVIVVEIPIHDGVKDVSDSACANFSRAENTRGAGVRFRTTFTCNLSTSSEIPEILVNVSPDVLDERLARVLAETPRSEATLQLAGALQEWISLEGQRIAELKLENAALRKQLGRER